MFLMENFKLKIIILILEISHDPFCISDIAMLISEQKTEKISS